MATPQKIMIGLYDRTFELVERLTNVLQTALTGTNTNMGLLESHSVKLCEALDGIASAIADRQA